ncbi:MAG: serine/threonine-protein kinase [Gemmatimonadota bacterium]
MCVHCGAPAPGSPPFVSGSEAEDDLNVIERLTAALSPTYEVVRLVGRGGFCDVFEIYDTHLDRRLAVKVLRADLAWAPGMVPRFEREARALAKLNHPNIPPLYFVGEHEGMVYFAMPYIEGHSLGQLMALEGPLPPDRLIPLVLPVLDALEYAHGHGIIHRDIKPDNIVIDKLSGRPLLLDFGLAKQMTARPGASLPGLILGTPAYTSPEQVLGQPGVDHRSDIYGLGSTMYHLLTGKMIVGGDTPQEIIGQQLTGEIPLPSLVNPQIPGWLSDIVMCSLERNPDERFQSATAMAAALRAGERVSGGHAVGEPNLIRNIRHDDPTPAMVPLTLSDLGPRTSPQWLRREEDRAGRQSLVNARLGWLVGTLALFAMIIWYLFTPVSFVLRNSLILPIDIHTGDGVHRRLEPDAEFQEPIGRDEKVVMQWEVVQPSEDLQPQSAVGGLIRVEDLSFSEMLRKHVRRDIDGWLGASRSFAPRVTNGTTGVLRVTVRPGRGIALEILPGDTRVLGYFPLSDSSTVDIADRRGRRISYGNLESKIGSESGAFDVNVADSMFEKR